MSLQWRRSDVPWPTFVDNNDIAGDVISADELWYPLVRLLLGHIGDLLARSLRFATPPLLTDPDIQERFSPLPRKSDERRFLSSLPDDLCSIGHL